MDSEGSGSAARDQTADEVAFEMALAALLPGLDYWLHSDPDGEPWMLISMDVVRVVPGRPQRGLSSAEPDREQIVAVPRVDFDRRGVCGGYSPAFLNWDDGVRAADAGIETAQLPGCRFEHGPDLVEQTAVWFEARRDETLSQYDTPSSP